MSKQTLISLVIDTDNPQVYLDLNPLDTQTHFGGMGIAIGWPSLPGGQPLSIPVVDNLQVCT